MTRPPSSLWCLRAASLAAISLCGIVMWIYVGRAVLALKIGAFTCHCATTRLGYYREILRARADSGSLIVSGADYQVLPVITVLLQWLREMVVVGLRLQTS